MKPQRKSTGISPARNNLKSEVKHPSEFDRRILLCVAGLSPQIITETLYALATREDKFIPTEIHAITTQEGAERIRLTLLENDPQEHHFYRLCKDLNIAPESIRFNDGTIHLLGNLAEDKRQLEDIRSVGDNETAADNITTIVRELTADAQAAIHASIAGGRKTMGFYLGYAMSLFGREQDRLSHVLVSPPFESHNEFYYPPNKPKVLRDRDNRPIHTRNAEVTLADIPFVRLRGHLDTSILGSGMSYSDTVARTQRNVGPPRLIIDCAARQLRCGEQTITLVPNLFAFYCWFARRRLEGKPGIHWSEDDAPKEYLEEYAGIVGEFSGDYELAEESLIKPIEPESNDPELIKFRGDYETAEKSRELHMTPEFYDPKLSKINKTLTKILGKEPARPYLISNIGLKPGTRYHLKGLTLKPAQIQVLEK